MPVEMSDEDFDAAVEGALQRIPPALAAKIDNVAVFVEDRYEPEPWEDPDTVLLGLYEGIPLTERGGEPWAMPDRITLYKRAILDICESPDEVIDQVTITVVHEVAHFFGIDDATLHRLGWA
ncbi:metallopeptidase family protein [Nesterenkonia sp. MY13]|uniref:Metallopeptidase family protein n=1 Tax=Nesterenkonia sedimenti TaxID=1463632 RepID=A0A7X8TJE9_9MICC|nr:metallopeptidase family protein [Nesterenkonia sedimenti]NLS09437.1 metallopeptidase family protein [Nesterenkonia sedimenti]